MHTVIHGSRLSLTAPLPRLQMCICVNCAFVDRCKAYNFVEEKHGQPHVSPDPDFEPRNGSPTMQVPSRLRQGRGTPWEPTRGMSGRGAWGGGKEKRPGTAPVDIHRETLIHPFIHPSTHPPTIMCTRTQTQTQGQTHTNTQTHGHTHICTHLHTFAHRHRH